MDRTRNRFWTLAITLIAMHGVWCSVVDAAQPIVRRLEPLGVVRGQATKVTLSGERLGDAVSVLLDQNGLTITDIKAIDNNKIEMMVTAAADLPPGLYPFQLVTKTGVSNLRLIGVGALPVVQEVEPNSDLDAAQAIAVNTTMEGIIQSEDVDYFVVELAEGQLIHAEAEAVRLQYNISGQIFDPYVAILDEGRFEVASSDDSGLLQQDAMVAFKAPKAGKYRVLIRDSAFGGSGESLYRLHIGTFPRPIAVIPPGQKPGENLTATLVHLSGEGSAMTTSQAQVKLPAETLNSYPVVTQTDAGVSPSPNWVRVNPLPVTMEVEPNNDPSQATPAGPDAVGTDHAFSGVLGAADDMDCFAFECKKGEKVLVRAYAREIVRSPVDSVVHVFGPKNNYITGNDDANGKPDSFFEFTAAEDGPHKVRIYDSLKRGGPAFVYRIETELARPKLTLSRRELDRDEAIAVAVPRGSQMAMMLNAKRDYFGGDLNFEVTDLPAGVTATVFPMRGDRGEVPVLFTAAADAPDGAGLINIKGLNADPNNPVTGALEVRHQLLLGQNRVDMWGYDSKRLAVSVAEAVPFKITLHQPGTPIVRDGSKELKVSIERNPGFEGEVLISTLYSPPGIGVNNGRKIEKNANEVMIPITANGGAGVAVWPMLMVARYNTDQGQVKLVTPPIQLEVQEQLFKFEFPRMAAEQGKNIDLTVGVQVLRPFEGKCEVQLVGLPAGVTANPEKQVVTPESTAVTFPLVVAADAKVGNHKSLHCVATVISDKGDIVQTQGVGELRVDQPLPPKVNAPAPAPTPAAPEPPKPEAKPLSRLEQLRQMKP